MKVIPSKYTLGSTTEHYVFTTNEPTLINFEKQIEDILISSPDGDILVGWDFNDPNEFTKDNCFLIKVQDNCKEIGHERCTQFYLMPRTEGQTVTVYLTTQR